MFNKKDNENFKNDVNEYINKIKIFNFLKNNKNLNYVTNNTLNFINLFNNEKLNNKNIFFKDKYDLSNIYDIDLYFNNFLYYTKLKFQELNNKDLLNLINILLDLNLNKQFTFVEIYNIHDFYLKISFNDIKDLKNYDKENFKILNNFFKSINEEKKKDFILHIMNQDYEEIHIDKNIDEIFSLISNILMENIKTNTNINMESNKSIHYDKESDMNYNIYKNNTLKNTDIIKILNILKNFNINKLNIIYYLYIIQYIKIELEKKIEDNDNYDDIIVKSIEIEFNKLKYSNKNKTIYIINLLQSLINEIKYIINNVILNKFNNYIFDNYKFDKDKNKYKNLLDFFINREKDFNIFKSIEPNNIYVREFKGKNGVRSINFEDIIKISNKSFNLFSKNNKSEIESLLLKYLPYDYNDNHFMYNLLKCMKSLFGNKYNFNFENLDFIADIFKYGKNFYEIDNDKNTIEKLNNIINNIYEENNKNSKVKNYINFNYNKKNLDENIFGILKNYFFFESKQIFDIYIKTKLMEVFNQIHTENLNKNVVLNSAKIISTNARVTIPYKYPDLESFLSNDKLDYTINESNKIWDIDTNIDKLFETFKNEVSRKRFLNKLLNDPLFMLFIKLTKYFKFNFNYKNANLFHSTSTNIDNNKVNNALNNFLNEDRIKIIAVLCINNYEDLTLFQFHIDKYIILYNALQYEDFKEFKYFNIDLQKLKLYNIYNNINIDPSKIYNNHSGLIDFLRFISPDFEDSIVFKSERNKTYLSEFPFDKEIVNKNIKSILNMDGVRSILTQFLDAFDFVKKLKNLKFIEYKKLNKLENISKNNKEKLELNINKTINENPIIKRVINEKNYDSFYQNKSFFNFLKQKYDLNKLYLTQLVVAGALTRELDGHIQMLNLKLNINKDYILDDFFQDKNINNFISKITEELPFIFEDIKITDRQISSYIQQFNNKIIKSNNYFNTFVDLDIISDNFDFLT